jgi:hypothetical protein
VRLFETLRIGRPPVILADEWVPPEGPRWDEFSIRIAEKDYMQVPQILEAREGEAAAMGRLARQEWERWFSPAVIFTNMVDLCLDIKRTRRLPESIARWTVYPQLLRPHFFREWLRNLRRPD